MRGDERGRDKKVGERLSEGKNEKQQREVRG
jgi:hypothetical protein